MPMSPRLLRPRASGASHPEALDWAARVTANGGTVSSTTLAAVSAFCASIDAAGIRDRFLRLNLFCGNSNASLSAVRTPLYRGQSFAGTQLGATTDTSVNFVAGDYAETGATGGLKGDGSTKYIETGLPHATLNTFYPSVHLSCYITQAGAAALGYILQQGPGQGTGNANYALYCKFDATAYHGAPLGPNIFTNPMTDSASLIGHRIASRTSTTAQVLYRNGASVGSSSVSYPSAPASYGGGLRLFGDAIQFNPAGNLSDARLAGYSFGLGVTAQQAAAYNTAIKAFQTALGRP